MRGRKPLPTKFKILTGNPGKQKLPKGEPEPPLDMPSPPDHLDAYALEEWKKLAPGLNAMGVLTSVDGATFAAYCVSVARWRHAEEELNKVRAKRGTLAALLIKNQTGDWVQNPLIRISARAADEFVKYGAEFGLSPSSRARLAVDPGRGKPGKFDGLISLVDRKQPARGPSI
jgi:P27 family predicted phage terminase small subunit